MSDALTYYAAAVSTGGLLWQIRSWSANRQDARARDKLAYGTNLRVAGLEIGMKSCDLLELRARIVNDSGHDVVVRHVRLRWGDERFNFSDGWPNEVQLASRRSWLTAGENVDMRGHGTDLESDEVIGSRRGKRLVVWAAKPYFLANANSPVTLEIVTDDMTSVASEPFDWVAAVRDESGWEHIRTPGPLPPYVADTI